jgi:predicted nuclease of predicted toxin-antitoxin system
MVLSMGGPCSNNYKFPISLATEDQSGDTVINHMDIFESQLVLVGHSDAKELTLTLQTAPVIMVYSGENFNTRKWAKALEMSVQS